MAHTFANLLAHVVFSTRDRAACMDPPLRERLFPYMGGILREMRGQAIAVNGVSDHVHLLVVQPPSLSMSEMMRVLKTNSSRWVHEQWPERREFAWQAGYGAFSVSQSNCGAVRKYIEEQEAHHRRVTFREEFVAFLKRHGIAYDERYVWD